MNRAEGGTAVSHANDEVIDPSNAFLGARLVQDSAKRMLEDAIALYKEDRHGSAIALAVLASEESLKGIELSRYFRKRMPVTMDVWDKLKNHDYKLTNTYSWIIEQLQSEGFDEFYEKQTKKHGEQHINGVLVTPKAMSSLMETSKRLHKHMQSVKEACMYQNWNSHDGKWEKIFFNDEKSLAYYVIETAHTDFGMLLLSLDFALDTFIKNNPKLAKLKEPHPAVDEIPINTSLRAAGEKALQQFTVGDLAKKPVETRGSPGASCHDDEPPYMIDPEQASAGVGLIQNKAKRLYEDAASLYSTGSFQNTMVLAILSIEESLKGELVAAKAQKNLGLTEKQWNKLKIHDYKLNIDALAAMLDQDNVKEFYKIRITRRAIPTFGRKKPTRDDIKSFRAHMKSLRSGLNSIKKMCLYNEWITQYSKWDEFGYLEKGVQDDLAFCLIDMAKWQLAACELVARFPPPEDEADHDSDPRWSFPGPDYDNPHKLLSGELALGAVLQEKLFAISPQVVTRNIAKRCMGIIGYSFYDSTNWHPFVKAFFLAYGRPLTHQDGECTVEADNARQTYEGKPTMHASVTISKEGFRIVCKKITVNGVEYEAHDSRIDALLGVEEVLTRWHGPEVSVERIVEAFAKIGVGIYMLRDAEVENAIRMTNEGVEAGRLPLPREIADDVRAATRGGWGSLNPLARAYIATVYKKKTNALVLSSAVDPIRKSKIRDMAWEALTRWKEDHEMLAEKITQSQRGVGD